MIENDYPIPSYMADVFEKPEGWVETPQPAANELKTDQKIYAIDCEMVSVICFREEFLSSDEQCVTEDGKELTRVCLIDFTSGIVIYDQLVKPSKPILDYLTRYKYLSG